VDVAFRDVRTGSENCQRGVRRIHEAGNPAVGNRTGYDSQTRGFLSISERGIYQKGWMIPGFVEALSKGESSVIPAIPGLGSGEAPEFKIP
jgi:hypothetical protein